MTITENMFIVAEFLTAHNAMDIFRRPMGFSVRGIGSVAWTDIQERGVGMIKEASDPH